ncbi:MAG: MBL fold metallo-hydrolase [Proteobacteria bacterium]|nr:MBL fold metallo-hydrolase [Pseudomonadota bacterium]
MQPVVATFYDPATATMTHVLSTGDGSPCAIVDPVLDFDAKSGRTSTVSADKVAAYVREHALTVQWLLETHAHADHLTAAPYLQRLFGGTLGVGAGICNVQHTFRGIYHLEPGFVADGSQFGHLFVDDETFAVGPLTLRVMHVPGHTPADVAYVLDGEFAFIGDTLFMPDVGSARCDFPGGDAATLYRSARRILDLAPATRLYLCHDYPPAGRTASGETTVAAERAHNVHLRDGVGEAEFVAMREARDRTLSMPALILPAIQVNIRAGQLPPAEENGVHYLKIPVDAL